MVFDDVTLILPEGELATARLRVENGVIEQFGPARSLPLRVGEPVFDGLGGYLSPGFVDLHAHGAVGRDAMEATPEAFAAIRRFHATGGTTAMALTTVAAPFGDLRGVLKAARQWKADGHPADGGAALLGIHVEGPYFSPAKAGAHRPEFLRLPTTSRDGGTAGVCRCHHPDDPRARTARRAGADRRPSRPGHHRQRRPQRRLGRGGAGGVRAGHGTGHAPVQRHVRREAARPLPGGRVARIRAFRTRHPLRTHRRRPPRFAHAAPARLPGQGSRGHLPRHGRLSGRGICRRAANTCSPASVASCGTASV